MYKLNVKSAEPFKSTKNESHKNCNSLEFSPFVLITIKSIMLIISAKIELN
jgi:hypothetical protein